MADDPLRVSYLRMTTSSSCTSPTISTFRGDLEIGNLKLECHVLNDLRRVLTQREVVRVLSGGRESGNLSRYLSRNPLISKDFESGPTIQFRVPGAATIAIGYEATLLIEICEKYLEARDRKLLKKSQLNLATRCRRRLGRPSSSSVLWARRDYPSTAGVVHGREGANGV